ncbi:MAG: hypothetical protein SFU99_18475, partial [Saprospiraceae bacterium]|nr:hypothetical protein [Saprospiraceae bacterium]
EVGHAKNVANLEDLIARCISYLEAYNPSRMELQIGALQQLHQEAQMVLRQLAEREVWEQDAANNRALAFKALRPLVTRIINTMRAYGLSAKSIEDACVIQRKINGTRASKKNNTDEAPATTDQTEGIASDPTSNEVATAPRSISTARLSYDLLVEHFSKLVLLLQRETNYNPNEPDLQLSGLQAHEQYLRTLITTATNAEAESERVRIQRWNLLYEPTNGLVARAKQVKSYIKAVFGSTSPQYKQVSKLSFRVIR